MMTGETKEMERIDNRDSFAHMFWEAGTSQITIDPFKSYTGHPTLH
jgi:hypothetical protein